MEHWRQGLLAEHLALELSDLELEQLAAEAARDKKEGVLERTACTWSERDFAFFARYYLPHYFDKPFAEMHWELSRDIEATLADPEGQCEVVAWPRGHGKSTCVCVGVVLWSIAWKKKHYIIVIKDSFDQAKLELRAVKHELEHNERLVEDFGSLVGDKWDAAQIITSNDVLVEVLGTGMKIRGRRHGPHRPDLIIVDDPESLLSVDSPTQRAKTKRYFHRSVMKAGDETTDVFVIGTRLHTDCLVASLLDAPFFRSRLYKSIYEDAERQDLWDQWRLLYLDRRDPDRQQTARQFYDAHEEEMLRGVDVAWPEGFPYYRLQVMRLGEQDEQGSVEIHSFEAEMQNEPVAAGERVFVVIGFYYVDHRASGAGQETWLVPYEFGDAVPLRECQLYGACDPSLGESERSDFSAIIDLLLGPSGQKFVGAADIERRLPDQIISAILDHVRFWEHRGLTYAVFGIESVGFQKLMATDTAKKMMEQRRYVPIEEVQARGSKYSRIVSLQPDLKNQYILLLKERGEALPRQQRRLYDQLRDYPSVAHDDGPDALEMANRVSELGAGESFTEYLEEKYGAEPESPEDLMERLSGKGMAMEEW